MKIFGIDFKFNNFDVWHKGNLTKVSDLANDSGFISGVPVASDTILGGIKVGSNLSVANGVLSVADGVESTLNANMVDGYHAQDILLPLVIGTQGSSTNAFTGNAPDISALFDGLTIRYWLPYAGTSTSATLNLTLADASTTGAIAVYYGGTTRLTSHYGAGSFLTMIYRVNANVNGSTYTGWWVDGDYDSNNFDRMYWGATITAGQAINDYKLIMQGTDGKFYPLTLETGTGTTKTVATNSFSLDSPILYYNSTTNIAINGTFSNVYSEINTGYLNYTANQSSFTSQTLIYLRGTIDESGNFILDNASYTSWLTQTLPTSDDGFVYILLGYMYSTTSMRLFSTHPIYEYKDGCIRLYIPNHTHTNDHVAITTVDTSSIDITLTGQQISASAIFGTSAGTICQGNDSRLSDARTPLTHSHAESEITGLVTDLAGKEPVISTKNTAFNKNYGTTATDVKMNGTQAVGTVDAIARIDHVHPTDTSRQANITAGTTAQYYRGDKTWQTLNASAVGLGSVTNESKATMFASPALTGTPTAPTASAGTSTTQIATTAFVATAVAGISVAGTAIITSQTQPPTSNTGDVWIDLD